MWGPFILRTALAPLGVSACAGFVAAGASRFHFGRGLLCRLGSGAWFALRVVENAPRYACRVFHHTQGWHPRGSAHDLSATLPGHGQTRAPWRQKAPPCVPALLPQPLLMRAVSARGYAPSGIVCRLAPAGVQIEKSSRQGRRASTPGGAFSAAWGRAPGSPCAAAETLRATLVVFRQMRRTGALAGLALPGSLCSQCRGKPAPLGGKRRRPAFQRCCPSRSS